MALNDDDDSRLEPAIEYEGRIFTPNSSRVRSLALGTRAGTLFALDAGGVNTYAMSYCSSSSSNTSLQHSTTTVRLSLPRPNFVSALVGALVGARSTSGGWQVLLAACLDGTLKAYAPGEQMRIRSSMPWTAGTVSQLLFNPEHDTLVSSGSCGVVLWGSCTAVAKAARALPAERPWLDGTGRPVPWCSGLTQRVEKLLVFKCAHTCDGAKCMHNWHFAFVH